MKLLFMATTLLSVLSGVRSIDLTKDDFADSIQGKNAFVKFFAPWCGHCKSMKPAWDELAEIYSASSSVVIGDVDCTADESKDLCEDYEVKGFPTIKYFLDGDEKGKSYEGGRDFDALKSFIEVNLEVKCNPSTLAECSEKEQGYIKKMKALPFEDIKKQAARLEKMAGESMKVELKKWLHQRLHILHMMGA